MCIIKHSRTCNVNGISLWTDITDVVIEDIEDKSVFEDTTMTSLVDATTSTEDEWLDFRSTFESLAKQSEVEIHQQRTQDTIERLKDDLIVNMLAASGFNPTTHSDDSSLEGEPSDSVDKNNSTKITATVKRYAVYDSCSLHVHMCTNKNTVYWETSALLKICGFCEFRNVSQKFYSSIYQSSCVCTHVMLVNNFPSIWYSHTLPTCTV